MTQEKYNKTPDKLYREENTSNMTLYYTAVGLPDVSLVMPKPTFNILIGEGRKTSRFIPISLEEYVVWDTCSRKIIDEDTMLDETSKLFARIKKSSMTLPRAITELEEKGLLLTGRTMVECINECFYLPLLSCTNHLFAHDFIARMYIRTKDFMAKMLPDVQQRILEAYKENLALNICDYENTLSSTQETIDFGYAVDELLRNKFLVAMGRETMSEVL